MIPTWSFDCNRTASEHICIKFSLSALHHSYRCTFFASDVLYKGHTVTQLILQGLEESVVAYLPLKKHILFDDITDETPNILSGVYADICEQTFFCILTI